MIQQTATLPEAACEITPESLICRFAAMGVQLSGVADDSRKVRVGDLFMAYPGDLNDGRRHIGDALARGASAVFWEDQGDFKWNPDWRVANLSGSGLRALCGPLAHAVFGQPSERQ